MKTINIKLKLFSYDELKRPSKLRAFEEHKYLLYSLPIKYENEKGELLNDWLENWEEEEQKEYIEDSLRANEYLFFEDGKMANIIHFTGKHEKAGTTELCFLGETYKLK